MKNMVRDHSEHCNVTAIILGAGRGVRRLRSADSYPISLVRDDRGLRLLDWILAALRAAGISDVSFVGGYHVEKLIRSYPGLRYFYNQEWESSGSLHSLLCADEAFTGECIVVNADVLFHADLVASLLAVEGDIVPGYVIHNGSPTYTGCVKFTRRGVETFKSAVSRESHNDLKSRSLLNFLNRCVPQASSGEPYVIDGSWLKIESDLSIARFVMSSKGQTLERLRTIVKSANILAQVRFTVAEWLQNADQIIESVQANFPEQEVIVRSSSSAEDGFSESKAGYFESVLNIDSRNSIEICSAIEKVISSFGGALNEERDEVFIQPMVRNIAVSGVIFTKDIRSGADYIIINYDDKTGRSDTITSGDSKSSTLVVFKDRVDLLPNSLNSLSAVIFEVEKVLCFDELDIEFAIDQSGVVFILQVRPLMTQPQKFSIRKNELEAELSGAVDYLTANKEIHPQVVGGRAIFSDMSDWNPAEIIGTAPRKLAVSLYRRVITDRVWAWSRAALGYRNVDSVPLMSLIAGKPFINMRASFNSFIPASVSDELAAELVEIYSSYLVDNPELYDKIEFEVVPTCLDFDFERYQIIFDKYNLDISKQLTLREALRSLTDSIIRGEVTPHSEVDENIAKLNKIREDVLAGIGPSIDSICKAVDLLLDSVVRYGTINFANVARHAFIATSFLRSMRSKEAITTSEFDAILESMATVASNTSECMNLVASGEMALDDFVATYGHLRPGTYDITTPSYAEDPSRYLGYQVASSKSQDTVKGNHSKVVSPLRSKKETIEKLIADTDLTITSEELICFIERSIPLRESVKFEFTKNLSAAISLLRDMASEMDMSVEQMSYLSIDFIRNGVVDGFSKNSIHKLKQQSQVNQKQQALYSNIRLPGLISDSSDLFFYIEKVSKPNFVSSKSLTADVAVIEGKPECNIEGRLVLIESADPGYDWIFSHGIAGLITKYGGVASHMAIRCSEFHLPAVIGCGESLYSKIELARRVHLDCAAQKIELL